MFSFVDLRLALLLGAAVLVVRAQGEDDRKSGALSSSANWAFLEKWIFSLGERNGRRGLRRGREEGDGGGAGRV